MMMIFGYHDNVDDPDPDPDPAHNDTNSLTHLIHLHLDPPHHENEPGEPPLTPSAQRARSSSVFGEISFHKSGFS